MRAELHGPSALRQGRRPGQGGHEGPLECLQSYTSMGLPPWETEWKHTTSTTAGLIMIYLWDQAILPSDDILQGSYLLSESVRAIEDGRGQ